MYLVGDLIKELPLDAGRMQQQVILVFSGGPTKPDRVQYSPWN